MSKVKYDGWCTKAFGKILPWSFHTTRTGVIEWWDDAIYPPLVPLLFKWNRFRKRGTHKIVKVRIVEVEK